MHALPSNSSPALISSANMHVWPTARDKDMRVVLDEWHKLVVKDFHAREGKKADEVTLVLGNVHALRDSLL